MRYVYAMHMNNCSRLVITKSHLKDPLWVHLRMIFSLSFTSLHIFDSLVRYPYVTRTNGVHHIPPRQSLVICSIIAEQIVPLIDRKRQDHTRLGPVGPISIVYPSQVPA